MRYEPGDIVLVRREYDRFYVYELIDDNSEPFYIGMTAEPARRLSQHLHSSRFPHMRNDVFLRLASLKEPRMRIVATYPSRAEAQIAERALIRKSSGLTVNIAGTSLANGYTPQ